MGIKDLTKSKLTRRTFLQGMAAVGAAATVSGCSSGEGETVFVTVPGETGPDLSNAQIYNAGCIHNCGAGVRCVSTLHVVEGRIVRVTSDESINDFEGNSRGGIYDQKFNDTRALACAKGRSYKYRVYNSGRVRYPLKQTKKRGDLSGFIAITPEQAMKEIIQKYRAVHAKWGSGAINNIYATAAGYGGTYSAPGPIVGAIMATGGGMSSASDYSYHQFHQAYPITGHPGLGYPYTHEYNIAWHFNNIAEGGTVKNIVSWGSNSLSTNNSIAFAYIKAVEDLKARNSSAKVIFIGPEFTDAGVSLYTDWYQLRNYTDTALVMGMLYHMIVSTFNDDGTPNTDATPKLDLDYIDTMVHGFFDSPAYYVVKDIPTTYVAGTNVAVTDAEAAATSSLIAGTISATLPASEVTNWTAESDGFWYYNKETPAAIGDEDAYNALSAAEQGEQTVVTTRWQNNADNTLYAYTRPFEVIDFIEAVPAGQSLSAYVMGSDDRLTQVNYGTGNYTAAQFTSINGADLPRNGAICNYPTDATSEYLYKQDMLTPKSPAWAEAITGVPAAKIEELAELYLNPANHPIFSEWAGGCQKQENGVINIWAIASMLCVTKTFGMPGEGLFSPWASDFKRNRATIGDINDYLNQGNMGAVVPVPLGSSLSAELGFVSSANKVPAVSTTSWFNGIKMAFHDKLTAEGSGYTGSSLPAWDKTTRYVGDDAYAKSMIKYKFDSNGNHEVYTDADGNEYYDYEGREEGTPQYAGVRMMLSAGGNIFVNQHMNSNDLSQMYAALPLSDADGESDPDNLCLVTFDPYMSPSARFSDYVIPVTMALEAGDWLNIGGLGSYDGEGATNSGYGDYEGWYTGAGLHYRPPVSKAPGESYDAHRWTYLAYKTQSELGSPTGATVPANPHGNYVGTSGDYVSYEVHAEKLVDDARNDSTSRFSGMSRGEVYAKQYRPRKNEIIAPDSLIAGTYSPDNAGRIRQALEGYLGSSMDAPFVYTNNSDVVSAGSTDAWALDATITPGKNCFVASSNTGYSALYTGSAATVAGGVASRPNVTGKFQVYNRTTIWEYENRLTKYHGWLPAAERGNSNRDAEGDARVHPVPMYYAFQDNFKEAYDGFTGGANADFFTATGADKPLTMSTTHDRFRVHSTHNENPLMRELNHRQAGTEKASTHADAVSQFKYGNDWNSYCVVNETGPQTGMISQAVQSLGAVTQAKATRSANASWHEIWINTEDAAARSIADGDLVLVENPIGKVRVVARVSNRCMRGHVNLHQGGWYDPNPVDGVDDGGCANTLISSALSKLDNGNGQQFAYVKISKVS